MLNLPGEIVQKHIYGELYPADIYNLSKTSKDYQQYVTLQHFKNRVIKRINKKLLKIFGPRLSEFKDILQETRAVISGSFIIRCLLKDKRFSKGDIDVYVPTKDNIISALPSSIVDDFLYHKMGISGTLNCNKTRYAECASSKIY